MLGNRTNTGDCQWLLGSLCNLYRIPFDAALVASQFPPPYTLATLHEAARALGFKTGSRPLPSDGWQKLSCPCIAFLKPETQYESSEEAAPATPILIVKTDQQQVLYFRPNAPTPETLAIADAATRLEPDLILVAREHAGADGQPEIIAGFETEKPKFGFRWFIPEALKHKKIWRDVVLASFAIQLKIIANNRGQTTVYAGF